MGRMLDALKTLDTRAHDEVEQAAPPAEPLSIDWEAAFDEATRLFDDPLEESFVAAAEDVAPLVTAPPPPTAPFETCALPIAPAPAEYYLEMADQIGQQLVSNYCNVILFVAADRWVEPAFSMTHLAQAFALPASGDVLLVDGDLRFGKLSNLVARRGPGMVEAMLGQAQWPDIIHPTNLAHIDFVARGRGQVPTVERPQFGWGALRPLYRTVLIGPANQSEPETAWLAARCDAVYLILSRPHTRRSTAIAAVNALRETGANVVGCIVVND